MGYVLIGAAASDALIQPRGDGFAFGLMIVGAACIWYGRYVWRGGRPWF